MERLLYISARTNPRLTFAYNGIRGQLPLCNPAFSWMLGMSRYQKRLGYLVAIVASTLVLVLRLALTEQLAEQARLLPFVIAVMAAAWWGGLKPGLLATLLGAFLGILFVVPPAYSLSIETVADGLNAAIFVFVGVT